MPPRWFVLMRLAHATGALLCASLLGAGAIATYRFDSKAWLYREVFWPSWSLGVVLLVVGLALVIGSGWPRRSPVWWGATALAGLCVPLSYTNVLEAVLFPFIWGI